jgi:hypothetical protein
VLRATVSDTVRCLDELSVGQRRVLTLRAGVGAGPPRSRAGVARRLRITTRRVIRLERSGLERLRRLDRAGACAPPAATTLRADAPGDASAGIVAVSDLGAAGRDGASGGGAASGGAASGGDAAGPGGHRNGERGKDGPRGGLDLPLGDVAGATATNRPGGLDSTVPLILLALVALAALAVHLLRRGDPTALALTRALRGDSEAVAALKRSRRPADDAPWVPWFRSPMKGPSWNDPRPPSDRPDEWSE